MKNKLNCYDLATGKNINANMKIRLTAPFMTLSRRAIVPSVCPLPRRSGFPPPPSQGSSCSTLFSALPTVSMLSGDRLPKRLTKRCSDTERN